jgi:hypothetical protein
MKINLHIERLVLEGLPLERAQGPQVQAAVQQELTRLLGANGVAPGLPGAMPYARGSEVSYSRESTPRQLGTQIAQSVHGGLSSSE